MAHRRHVMNFIQLVRYQAGEMRSDMSTQTGSVKNTLLIILLVATVFVLFVTTRYWPVQEGVVMDEASGEPLGGVFVTARYLGILSVIGDFQTVCYRVAGTTTDGKGRYRLPAQFDLPGILIEKRLQMDFFKPGYRQVFYDDYHGVAKLRKDSRDTEARFDDLKRVIRASGCDSAGVTKRSLYPLYQAVFYEAKSLAITQEEMKDLDWIRKMAARMATASDESRSYADAESAREDFLREHLK